MLGIGGKGGGGVGQLLAAAAAALLLRLFSGPGPVLLPDEEEGQVPAAELKVAPVTIKWSNINCSLSDKSSKLVSGVMVLYTCAFLYYYYVSIEPLSVHAEHCSLCLFCSLRG